MKTLLKILTIAILAFTSYSTLVYGDIEVDPGSATTTTGGGAGANTPAASEGGGRTIKITVTEKIPGVECNIRYGDGEVTNSTDAANQVSNGSRRYECLVPIGWTAFLAVLGRMIRFLTGMAILSAVLFLVFNGIRLSMSGIDGEAKGKVKSQIMMTLGGIILLLLSGPILKLIAPWVYT